MKRKSFSTTSNLIAVVALLIIAWLIFWEMRGKQTYQERQAALEEARQEEIVLSSNPTTGYTWQYTYLDETQTDLLEINQEYYSDCSDAEIAGCGGYDVFTLKGLKTGEARLKFTYERTWESEPPLESIIYKVTIDENKALSVEKEGAESETATE
ncbi:MAG: protease inhibitor I42 family protein [bacterium]|nr:protease inhibitor I42 family protein [bacterium]